MGRTKKVEEVSEEVVNTGTANTKSVVDAYIAPVEAPKAKTQRITITASYKTKSVEGEITKHRFSGSGDTVLEALNDIKGSDEEIVDEYGAQFPARINQLVNVTVKRGEYQFDRALAAHNATAIITNKNVALLNQLFGL